MTETVVATAFGGPDVLRVIEQDLPAPGAGEVTVEFRAIGVNPADYKQVEGAFGRDPDRLPMHIGSEGAGVVVAVGSGAVGPRGPISVGDEVVVFRGAGTYARRANQRAAAVLPKPAELSWERAAGLLLVGATAYDSVESAGVRGGDVVLVHGATGGVGLIAVQLARLRGATVIGTARESNHEFLRGFGVLPVTYGPGLAERVRAAAPGRVTVAIDTAGTDEAIDASLELVTDRSRIVTIAAFERSAAEGIVALGGGNPDSARRRDGARGELIDLAAAGKISTVIAKTFPLTAAAQAHTELRRPHAIGKFILIP